MFGRLARIAGASCVGLAAMLVSGCVAIPVTGAKREPVVYTPAWWPAKLVADVYRPQPGGRPAPAVLLVHGGGIGGTGARWEMNGIAAKLVTRG